jgi:hypothetical protein
MKRLNNKIQPVLTTVSKILALAALLLVGSAFLGSVSHAQSGNVTITCADGTTMSVSPSLALNGDACGSRGGTESNVESSGEAGLNGEPVSDSPELNKWLNDIVNLLSAVVGIVIVGSIIVAGVQYTTAGSNASQVSAAKNRITMAVLSLILFLFAFTLLQWLIPGGISILN